MAVVKFSSAVDMAVIDIADWFDVTATSTSSTSMTFTTPGQSVVVTGTGFSYIAGLPISGTVTGMNMTGAIDGTVSSISIAIGDVIGALNGPDPTGDMADLFFGAKDAINAIGTDDILAGFGGNDRIKAGKGNDTLIGGEGLDLLTGGRGADVFDYDAKIESTLKHRDVIQDLEAKDRIDLTDLNVRKLSGIDASYNEAKDLTTFSIDINNDGKVDMAIAAVGDHTDFSGFII